MECYCKDYPRPQFVRGNWKNLNGEWKFRFDDRNLGEKEKWYTGFQSEQKIQVPFTYETKLSGIEEEKRHDDIWYERILEADAERLKTSRYILHFEGSDYLTKVWINGTYAGCHQGAYERFSFDISGLLKDGENILVVKAEDTFDAQQPRGKQRWLDHNFGCWYMQTTGIWKTVWSEYVPQISLNSVKMTPNLEADSLEVIYEVDAPEEELGEDLVIESCIRFKGTVVEKSAVSMLRNKTAVSLNVFYNGCEDMEWGIRKWSPEHPDLYDITFRVLKNGQVFDVIRSYFAMREISIDGGNILINGDPLYQRLILDQGYWKDSRLTPPSEEALIEDIEKVLKLGYNGVRKHQKIEDERFLYWCDVKGLLVWSEMAATYEFSDYAVEQFTKEWLAIVRQNYNHPCIIVWTPFNESWGIGKIRTKKTEQSFTEGIYYLTKSIDPFRPVVVNDGWEHTVSDIITLHDYEEAGDILKEYYSAYKNEILHGEVPHNRVKMALANGFQYRGQPVIISEYGGIAFNNNDSGWGYGKKEDSKEDFVQRFEAITRAVKELPYVCGYCYTQVTDVQQEINGLMDEERNFKVDPEIICEINKRETRFRR